MIEKIRELDGHTFYRDTEGNKFSRVLAGLAWPTSKPGFIIVTGEDYHEDPDLKVRHLRALAEAEESDTEKLLNKVLDLRERYCVERVMGDLSNESMAELLYDFNKHLDGASPLTLYDASFPDDLYYNVSLIMGVTRFNRKTLHIDQCNTLRGHLSSITLEDAQQGRAGEHPAVMAIGSVVSYVNTHPRDPVKDRIKQIPREDERYDPLTFGM